MNRTPKVAQLLSARRRADEFASALAGDGPTVAAVAPLVRLAHDLEELAADAPQPRAAFRADLRSRLLAAAAEPPTVPDLDKDDEGRSGHVPRRLVAAACGLVIAGGGTGVAAAAQQALPGDMLYPVKRALEELELVAAGDTAGRGREHLERATTRLLEVDVMTDIGVNQGEVRLVSETLARFTDEAEIGSVLLMQSYADDGDAEDLVALRVFTYHATEGFNDLAEQLPAGTQSMGAQAAEMLVALDAEAESLCPDCTSDLPDAVLDPDLTSQPAVVDPTVPGLPVDPVTPPPGEPVAETPADDGSTDIPADGSVDVPADGEVPVPDPTVPTDVVEPPMAAPEEPVDEVAEPVGMPTPPPAPEPTPPAPEPTSPTADPTSPTSEPTESGEEPTEPVDTPTEPVDTPTEPVDTPTEPVDPMEPAADSVEPVVEPTEPVVEPTEPRIELPEPPVEPSEPDLP